jgi:hypothetical protein
MSADVSEEHITSIFMIEEQADEEIGMKQAPSREDAEDGNMFLRNVC